MGKEQKIAIKTQNTIQVFFAEKLQAFYVKEKTNHQPTANFKVLFTCEKKVFYEFLTFLEQFKSSEELKSYEYLELKDKLNEFLISSAANSKKKAA